MLWARTVQSDAEVYPACEWPEPQPRRPLAVRIMTRGLSLGVFATTIAALIYLGQPSRDTDTAAVCDGLAGYVQTMAVHADGATISACNSNGSLTLWATGLDSSVTMSAGDPGVRSRIAIAADGSELLVAELDGSLTIRDGMTGRPRRRLEVDKVSERQGLAYDREADLVASANSDGVDVWHASTGQRVGRRLEMREAITLAIAPGGRALAIGERAGMVRVVDPAGGDALAVFQAHESAIWSLAFTADGRMLATAGRQDSTVRVWDAATGRVLAELDGETLYQVVAFSPGGRVLATAGHDGAVRLWDPAAGRRLEVISGRRGHVTALAFSPDAQRVACGGNGWIGWHPVAVAPGS